MTHVVERCPSCGVEHDLSDAVECEACGTALRPWCRRHSREAGWLDGPACPHCVKEDAPVRPPAVPVPPLPLRPLPPFPRHPSRVKVPARPVMRGLGAPPPSPRQRLAAGRPLMKAGAGVGGLLGAVAGLLAIFDTGIPLTGPPLQWGLGGAAVGLVVTVVVALLGIVSDSSR
jgi:hypothetical protein